MIRILVASLLLSSATAQVFLKDLPEDGQLNFTGLAVKYGQKAEEFDVITDDGYILKLFHIIGDASRPVLFIHGLGASSDGFIIRGKRSLALGAARRGYDVWAMNVRGNRYSRRHLALRPDADRAFWDYYVHDFGTKDLPATIDFIALKTTGKVSVVGYSQGATKAFVLGATKPEYNNRINVLIALAPICYMHHTNPLLLSLFKFAPELDRGLWMLGSEEVGGLNTTMRSLSAALCKTKDAGYILCVKWAVFPLGGANEEALEPEFIPVLVGHYPAGTSRKTINHIAQTATSKRFAHYDYGRTKNLAAYNAETPPAYDLRKVTMRVAVVMGKNDKISTFRDVKLLMKMLPNVVDYRVLEYEHLNHVDFLWGNPAYTKVLPHLIELLDKYSERWR